MTTEPTSQDALRTERFAIAAIRGAAVIAIVVGAVLAYFWFTSLDTAPKNGNSLLFVGVFFGFVGISQFLFSFYLAARWKKRDDTAEQQRYALNK